MAGDGEIDRWMEGEEEEGGAAHTYVEVQHAAAILRFNRIGWLIGKFTTEKNA